MALRARRPRHRVSALQKLFWIVLRRFWAGWKKPLILVTPRTAVGWHRAGFRLYWRLISRVHKPGGRKPVSKEIRALIFRMAAENPTWGAPRIHGELLKLGFDISEPTVSRWLRRVPRTPDRAQRWVTFLRNHREAIAAMDFFTVPTITFGVLYCFFVISHSTTFHLAFKPKPSFGAKLETIVCLVFPRLNKDHAGGLVGWPVARLCRSRRRKRFLRSSRLKGQASAVSAYATWRASAGTNKGGPSRSQHKGSRRRPPPV